MVLVNDTYEILPYEKLDEKYASMNTSYDILGYVVYNTTTGERMKMRNPMYEEVKALRGNQTKLQFQYLSLRSQCKVKDYLKYYPESKRDFSKYRDDVHRFTSTLYTNYYNHLKDFPIKKQLDAVNNAINLTNSHVQVLNSQKDNFFVKEKIINL